MRKIIIGLLSQLLLLEITYGADPDLEKRVKQLESDVVISQEQTTDLEHKISNSVSISGYADVEYVNSTETGKKPGFGLHHFSLFFKKNISKQWRFFSEVEYEDGPFIEFDPTGGACNSACSGTIFLEVMNFDYENWVIKDEFTNINTPEELKKYKK